ncbi:MAG: formylglycine-generating enzyme family protein [Verrucomicrobiota bacterium]
MTQTSKLYSSVSMPSPFPPLWAVGWGEDRHHGVFADLPLKEEVSMEMRWIPPGRFLMGSPEGEPGRSDDEKQHEVVLTQGYWMGRTVVTQAQWKAVMGDNNNPSQNKEQEHEDSPVDSVNWDDCVSYCERVNEFLKLALHQEEPRGIQGVEVRLPTEAEWEYACRAGTESAYNNGKNGTEPEGEDPAMEEVGWYSKNSGSMTHEVGQKQANGWGLYDMHGNVWEWCKDWYDESYYKESPLKDPQGPDSGLGLDMRVLRGGGYWSFAGLCRSAYRNGSDPSGRSWRIGFRLVVGQK